MVTVSSLRLSGELQLPSGHTGEVSLRVFQSRTVFVPPSCGRLIERLSHMKILACMAVVGALPLLMAYCLLSKVCANAAIVSSSQPKCT
jgi:hypothetical protein